MAYELDNRLVIGISTRALFDLSLENEIFEKEGVESYRSTRQSMKGISCGPVPVFRW